MSPRIIDGRMAVDQIGDGDITNAKLDSLFQGENRVDVDSVVAYTAFAIAYSDTPVVTVSPADGVQWVRVTDVTPGSFQWIADAAGSASWFSHGHR